MGPDSAARRLCTCRYRMVTSVFRFRGLGPRVADKDSTPSIQLMTCAHAFTAWCCPLGLNTKV